MGKDQQFWNKEYRSSEHLCLSDEPAEDLEKFCRWLERNHGKRNLNVTTRALDLGCGNGRNLIYLAQNYGMRSVGYDISDEAIKLAERASKDFPITYVTRSIEGTLDIADHSVDIVLDMMTSHFLNEEKRGMLRDEIYRVLKPGGCLFFKSFLAEQDLHVRRLLRDNPGEEADTYVHPEIGLSEHVWTERSMREFLDPYFSVHKVERSHKHMKGGRAFKRRTITMYAQKQF